MPELPEVETVRADLEQTLVGRSFRSVEVSGRTSVRGMSVRSFAGSLVGRRLEHAGRRAKWLLFALDDGNTLAVHLRMTGQLLHVRGQAMVAGRMGLARPQNGMVFETGDEGLAPVEAGSLPNAWTRARFDLDDGSTLFFNDIRRFGTLEVLTPADLEIRLGRYGIEPLHESWNGEDFVAAFRGRRCSVKALLLNQDVVAGLGNIYVDEACFRAGVRPRRQAGRVSVAERRRLFAAVTDIITAAVASRGTSFSDYRDASGKAGGYGGGLMVYGRGGEPCRRCAGPVRKVTHGGRGTHFCPVCQK